MAKYPKTLFGGSQRVVINEVGRLALPARYRKPFLKGEILLVMRQDKPCLQLYPISVWQYLDQGTTVPMTELLRLDQQNRFTLPAKWRQMPEFPLCELDNTLMVGVDDRLELWREMHWQTQCAQLNN